MSSEPKKKRVAALQRHHAETDLKLGPLHVAAKVDITTRGLAAIAGLVGVILVGTAGIVWVSTGPARRRARNSRER